MDYSKLGLDTDLVDAVKAITEASCSSKKMEKEELHPNQKKIDKNKNGKLDAQDFKMLRKEEEEVVEEEQIDESNKFVNVATSKRIVADAEKALNDNPNMFHGAKTGFKRQITIHKKHIENATNKLTKEQVEEIEALAAKHGLTEE